MLNLFRIDQPMTCIDQCIYAETGIRYIDVTSKLKNTTASRLSSFSSVNAYLELV